MFTASTHLTARGALHPPGEPALTPTHGTGLQKTPRLKLHSGEVKGVSDKSNSVSQASTEDVDVGNSTLEKHMIRGPWGEEAQAQGGSQMEPLPYTTFHNNHQ